MYVKESVDCDYRVGAYSIYIYTLKSFVWSRMNEKCIIE